MLITIEVVALAVQLNETLQSRLLELLNGSLRPGRLMGIGAAMAVDGAVVASGANGRTQRRSGRPLTTSETWHIGSVTKPFTATLLGLLVHDGRFGIDDFFVDLLPNLDAPVHPSWQGVTLRHLLTHTHGGPVNLPRSTQMLHPDSLGELTAERSRILGSILAEPLSGTPGSSFAYSNFGYTLAGHIAEQACASPYETLIDERVFEPLGLTSAGFGAPQPDAPLGHLHKLGLTIPVKPGPRADNGPIMSAAGRVHMSLTDLLAFGNDHLRALSGKPGALLSQAIASELSRLPIPGINSGSYACGWVVQQRSGKQVLWHNGSNTMWVSLLGLYPSSGTVLAFATNTGDIKRSEAAFAHIGEQMLAEQRPPGTGAKTS